MSVKTACTYVVCVSNWVLIVSLKRVQCTIKLLFEQHHLPTAELDHCVCVPCAFVCISPSSFLPACFLLMLDSSALQGESEKEEMLDSGELGGENAKVDTFKGNLRTSLYFCTVCYCHPAVFAVINATVEILLCNKLFWINFIQQISM